MNPYGEMGLYIAGPECFYPRGYSLWHAQRKLAEYYGFKVVLPNDASLKMDHEDLRLNADAIFNNLREVFTRTKIMILDLELFRSQGPDCGTLFEMGAAYAQNSLIYGYTRDKRSMLQKTNDDFPRGAKSILDQKGRKCRFDDLPFVPSVVAPAMIVEGDFYDCLKMVMVDLDERRKRKYFGIDCAAPVYSAETSYAAGKNKSPVVFLSGPARYGDDAFSAYAKMKEICRCYGLEALTPLDGMEKIGELSDDPLERACGQFSLWQKNLAASDIFLGDLDNFYGWEPCGDTAFEAGAAWNLGKKCYCFMPDARIMRERIPNRDGFDKAGNVVENFDYPVNLMFSSSMPVIAGCFEDAVKHISEDLKSPG